MAIFMHSRTYRYIHFSGITHFYIISSKCLNNLHWAKVFATGQHRSPPLCTLILNEYDKGSSNGIKFAQLVDDHIMKRPRPSFRKFLKVGGYSKVVEYQAGKTIFSMYVSTRSLGESAFWTTWNCFWCTVIHYILNALIIHKAICWLYACDNTTYLYKGAGEGWELSRGEICMYICVTLPEVNRKRITNCFMLWCHCKE